MTTIAFDGKILAADSKVSLDGKKFGEMDKIFRLKGGRWLVGCGDPSVDPLIVAWLNKGGKEKDRPDLSKRESFEGLIVDSKGNATEISNNLRLFPACVPWAGGSGGLIALVAMRCGKSAEEAVTLACDMDNGSGGPVRSVRVLKD